MSTHAPPFWTSCGFDQLTRDPRGWLQPTDAYWRLWLERPELALVEESCTAERALHAAMVDQPTRTVPAAELAAFQDDDARANHQLFLTFRDTVIAAGSLEAAYARFFRAESIQIPPLFLDLMVQAIVCNLLQHTNTNAPADAWTWRAAELLFRRQRVQVQDGRVLSGDAQVLDLLSETGGLGEVGRLLVQGGASLAPVQVEVLGEDNAERYLASRAGPGGFNFVLDFTHEVRNELPHGLTLTMTRARSGLKALARVLALWVAHFHGTPVQIEPEARVDDPAWRWHLGLDAESTQLLNDLYTGQAVSADRQARLISLFKLRFDNPADMREDVRGKPVYLGLAMASDGSLKLKPQNLLINLPLSQPS